MDEKIDRYANLKCDLAHGVLTIHIVTDESQVNAQPSQSGKTVVISTTGGACKIPNSPLILNLTLYRKK